MPNITLLRPNLTSNKPLMWIKRPQTSWIGLIESKCASGLRRSCVSHTGTNIIRNILQNKTPYKTNISSFLKRLYNDITWKAYIGELQIMACNRMIGGHSIRRKIRNMMSLRIVLPPDMLTEEPAVIKRTLKYYSSHPQSNNQKKCRKFHTEKINTNL